MEARKLLDFAEDITYVPRAYVGKVIGKLAVLITLIIPEPGLSRNTKESFNNFERLERRG